MTRPNPLRLHMPCALILLAVASALPAQTATQPATEPAVAARQAPPGRKPPASSTEKPNTAPLTANGAKAEQISTAQQDEKAVESADPAAQPDPAAAQTEPQEVSSDSQPVEPSSPVARLLPYLPSAILGLTVLLLLTLLLRKHSHPADGEDESLNEELSHLKRDAAVARDKFLELDQEYNKLEAQLNALDADFANLKRDYDRQARELAEARTSLALLRRDSDQRAPERRDYGPSDSDQRDDQSNARQDVSRPAPAPEKAPAMSYDPPASPPIAPAASALAKPGTQPQTFGNNPQRDYLQALQNPDLQPEFRRLHSPFGVSCRNLGQRTLAGASLVLERDNQVRSLFAVSLPSEILIFPGFSVDAGSNRGMLEGIYTFPADFSELTVATAAHAEPRGELFYLTRPGTFRNG